MAHWKRILSDATVMIRTIITEGQVAAGSVLSYEEGGKPEVSYWLGKEYWGKGMATRAVAEFWRRATPRVPCMHGWPKTTWARAGF